MILFAAALLIAPAAPANAGAAKPPMQCHQGPAKRRFGGTEWLVYGCSDRTTLVVVSARGNPALPFVFIIRRTADGGRDLYGEGNGSKAASDAAGDEIARLTTDELAQLRAATLTGRPEL